MPINKNALRRYRIINQLLRSLKKYTISEIEVKVNEQLEFDGYKPVTNRTIYNDLNSIEEIFGLPIVSEGDKYFYENRKYSIDQQSLNDEEKQILEMALQTFSVFQGSPFFDKFDDIITRLMTGSVLRKLHTPDTHQFVQVEGARGDSGQKWLEALYEAIISHNTLEIDYEPYGQQRNTRVISPYLLKEHNNKWYLVAYNHDKQLIKVYKVFRIQAIRQHETLYHLQRDFNADTFFRHSLGVFHSHTDTPMEIKLKFSPGIATLVLENPIHETMHVLEQGDSGLILTLQVIDSLELKNLIMSYGSDVEVLEPPMLRKKIKKEYQLSMKNYE